VKVITPIELKTSEHLLRKRNAHAGRSDTSDMHVLGRLLGVVLLGGVLLASGIYYESVEPHHWPYPDEDQLAADDGEYTGERVLLFGTVERVDPGDRTARNAVEADEETFTATVQRFDAAVEPGGVVQVYGTVRPNRAVLADRVRVVNPTGRSNRYKYAVSAIGALVVLIAFCRRWKIDRESLAFVSR
jgi:hypothetical protein